MRWDKRTQVIVLVGGLAVWGGVAYWRTTRPAPAPDAAIAGEARGRVAGPEKAPEPGRRGAGGRASPRQEGATLPALRLDLLDRPLPALTAEGKNLFASVVPPPPPPPPPPSKAAPGAAAPPPPDPFLEEARKLRVVALMQEDGRAVAFIADGNDIHSVKKNDVIRSRFLVKDVGEDVVVVSQPNGETEVRLALTPPTGAGQR